MIKTELQKMLDGELYDAGDAELAAGRSKARKLFTQYNALVSHQSKIVG